MMVYRLIRTQELPISIEEAWEFFSNPSNLGKITPPQMDFAITHQSGGKDMYAGQIIQYRVNVLPFVRTTWVTEITQVHAPHYFIDEQRVGPYALWHHQHRFTRTANGTEVTDEVNYAIPLGIIGRMANHVFVASQVSRIFDYRAEKLQQFFGNRIPNLQTA